MATWDDVRRLARALPETEESTGYGQPSWKVRGKTFVWDRPLRGTDLRALGETAPDGPILGVWVEHVGAKEALLADDPGVFFTTPHFAGHASVLVRLDVITLDELAELIEEAWLARAPTRLARQYLDR